MFGNPADYPMENQMASKIGPKELALKAQRETIGKIPDKKGRLVPPPPPPADDEDLSIPAAFKRTETPEQAAAREAKAAKAAKKQSDGVTLAPPLSVQKAIAADLGDDDEDHDPMLKALPSGARAAAVDAKSKKAKSLLAAAMAGEVSTADALSAIARLPKGKKAKKASQVKPEAAEAAKKESVMRSNTKTKTTAKKHDDAQPRGMAIEIGKLASRPSGASRAELIKLTGWKQQAWKWYFHNSHGNGFCQKFGYKLSVIEGKDGESRYRISKK